MHQLTILETGDLYWLDKSPVRMSAHPVYVYLIHSDANQAILIDSGSPRRLIGKSGLYLGSMRRLR